MPEFCPDFQFSDGPSGYCYYFWRPRAGEAKECRLESLHHQESLSYCGNPVRESTRCDTEGRLTRPLYDLRTAGDQDGLVRWVPGRDK